MNKLIILDLDGTLIDTPSGIVEAFQYVFESMKEEKRDDLEIKNTIGLPLEKAFSDLLRISKDDKKINLAINQYQKAFKEIILPKAQELIFPDVEKGLTELKELNYTLAIATSKYFKSAEALLKAARLDSYFTMVVGADQVKNPKPHAEMGSKIMDRLNSSQDKTIMIGDTIHDIQMAKNLGIKSIAVTYGVHNKEKLALVDPSFMADSFKKVVEYTKIS